MASNGMDAKSSGEIFRKDHPMILACNRHQATLLPVRLAYDSVGGAYLAGTVLAKNTTSGYFQRYDDSASSGLNTAKAVLMEDAEPASGDTLLSVGIFEGKVFKDKLIGNDAAAETDLKARTLSDSSGLGDILSF